MKASLRLLDVGQAHQALSAVWAHLKAELMAGNRHTLSIKPETRSSEQNRLMWVYLDAFAAQLLWPVNGQMVQMSAEDWKDVLSAAFKRETARIAMGLGGGVVMLGLRTSKMDVREMSEFVDFLQSVAADRNVKVEE